MTKQLRRLALQSAILYALFLIPTAILLAHTWPSDAHLSRAVGDTWQGIWWHFPGVLGADGGTTTRVILDCLTIVGFTVVTWLFYQGYRLLSAGGSVSEATGRQLWQTTLFWTALCGVILLAVVPFHSSDLYGYLNRGFQQSIHHTNPYLVTVSQIPGWQQDPLLHAHWIDNPCPYGFLFAQLTLWLCRLSLGNFAAAFLLFKLVNLLALLGTTTLVYQLARQLNHRRPWLTAYLFGANPLVLLHVMGNGHNDILMVFLLLAALWALFSARWVWACLPLLLLSVLTKYISVLAAPFILMYMLRQRQAKALMLGGVVSLLLLGLLAWPYIQPGQPWPLAAMLDNAGRPQHSLIELLSRTVYYPAKWAHTDAKAALETVLGVLKPLFGLAFMAFYLAQMVHFLRRKADSQALLLAIGLTMTVLVAFVSAKFHPWYVVMFLPLLLLLPEKSRLRRFGLVLALFQMGGFTLIQNIHVIGVALLTILPAWLAWKDSRLFKPTT